MYVVAVTLVITLTPFDFAVPTRWRVTISDWTVLDLVANVLLFVPIGFLAALAGLAGNGDGVGTGTRGNDDGDGVRLAARALVLGGALSLAIESAQLLLPTRFSSPWDVLTNAAGAALGGALAPWLRGRLDPARLVGRLALELPLMGVVYLLVPLGWLHALSVAGPADGWSLVVLGLAGGSLLGAIQRRYLGPEGVASAAAMAAVAGGWFLLMVAPAVTRAPAVAAVGALLVGLFTWHRASAPGQGAERRFELAALLRAAPFLGAYLLVLSLTTTNVGGRLERAYVVGIVEGVALFSLLGYVAAEAMGRHERSYRDAWLMVAGVALLAALLDASFRAGVLLPRGDAIPRMVANVVAAVYGGWLYHLQRDQVRRLLAASRVARS